MDGFMNNISGKAKELTDSVRISNDMSKLDNEKNQKYTLDLQLTICYT